MMKTTQFSNANIPTLFTTAKVLDCKEIDDWYIVIVIKIQICQYGSNAFIATTSINSTSTNASHGTYNKAKILHNNSITLITTMNSCSNTKSSRKVYQPRIYQSRIKLHFFASRNNVMENIFYDVMEIDFQRQYLLLSSIIAQYLIHIILHQLLLLSISVLVLMDILCLAIVISIEIQLLLHIFIQWIFYDTTRVLLLLLLHLFMNRIEILMDIHVMELNYDLLQVFIYVFEFDYITTMQFLKQRVIFNSRNKQWDGIFLCFFLCFCCCFRHSTKQVSNKSGSRIATNTSLIVKPNGRILNIIIINLIQALFARLISIQASTSIVFNIVLGIIHIKFKKILCLAMNNHQNIFFNCHVVYILLSQQKYYKSSYITL